MNTLEKYEKSQLKNLTSNKSYPEFNAGDTIKVHLKIKEGEKERVQVFEGVCIAKKKAGLNSAFTVRKISYGEGIERVIPLFSPQISKIELVKSGDVRRSKLYYLRKRSGKSARISEKNVFSKTDSKVSDPSEKSNKEDSSEKKENPESLSKKAEAKKDN
ncbi:MAG: 50S ribosomal protein L19 [alpha proteobacterium MED-G10]|nr:MAG: 50S ribosomal protein L19 [alpha proteobacterium MED-G10]|tara:strand:- start:13 stop:492 length:480 start_codon:yes stop_codon:yes gene_type:complete